MIIALKATSSHRVVPIPKSFVQIPDLFVHCAFKLERNPNLEKVSHESDQWISEGDNLSHAKHQEVRGLQTGLLAAYCYPKCGSEELKVCSDFLQYLFHVDDLSDRDDIQGIRCIADEVMNALYHRTFKPQSQSRLARLIQSLDARLTQFCILSSSRQRFLSTLDLFFRALAIQARARRDGVILSLDAYITLRRDSSGCRPCWVLIEVANRLHIPECIMEHSSIRQLEDYANDIVAWSNDIFSYNKERAAGDETHNLISIIIFQYHVGIQEAIDIVGRMCKSAMDRFVNQWQNLPKWEDDVDRDVRIYVHGLAMWIIGSLEWSFASDRYFGLTGNNIRNTLVLPLSVELHRSKL